MNLNLFNTKGLFEAATNLFEQLNIKLNSNTAEPLPTKDILKQHYKDNDTFQAIDKTFFIGIIDDSVFKATGMFDINYSYKEAIEQGDKNYNGLMLFALELKKQPTRTEISELTRAFNRISLKMPVALLLKYPPTSLLEENEALISIALSERFKYLQHWRQGEKAGKIIMLRDINTQNPHTGHIRILQDLVKPVGVNTYAQLHQHWLQVLDVNILNKKFFQELSNWYFSAINKISFPDDVEKNAEIRNATNLIRLITRVIFVWFLKEKHLVPASLFRKDFVASILKDFNKNEKSHNYYNAILQNLFFGTLNQKIEERKFVREGDFQTNREEYGVKNLFRYADLFTRSEQDVIQLFKDIPFLNGGLFDCLDKPNDEGKIEYVDGFSRNPKKKAIVPDYIFFGEEKQIDLNEVYGTKNKRYTSRGLINILESYKFTVTENTPLEEEIALDPELLGKVFENLLANYNPETQTPARKQTGSFYTPREIVSYMVEESLLQYLKSTVSIPADPKSTVSIPADPKSNVSIPADPKSNVSIPADDMNFFNPNDEIEIYQGNLPHWQQKGVWYFVTFRLADSIPSEVAEQIKVERELWRKKNAKDKNGNYSKEQIKEYNRLFSDRIETLLNDCRGSCVLKRLDVAKIVADALLHFNRQRYDLDAWVIMPNHVHVLVKPLGENKLDKILHSWKSFTANEINKVLGRKGQLWMHESYDHIVRNEKALQAIRNYIAQNPVKANLKEGEFLLHGTSIPADGGNHSIPADGVITRSRDASDTFETRLRDVFSYSENPNPFSEAETKTLIEALHNCKILDPACGSGAFPMGILHTMVHILQKLDPQNQYWKELQRKKAIQETEQAFTIGDKEERAKRLAEINDVFENNASDYGRKLYLIENCIYGIDIQPIAVQIAKLRFFISLVIDQKVSPSSLMDNMGIRPLPNLETKFVAANTLIGLDKPQQLAIRNLTIQQKEDELKLVRHQYFTANTRKKKIDLQKQDKQLRKEIAQLLKADGWQTNTAEQIASFDPYDQNHFANWFDPEWMFSLKEGFDIVIGNPPYIQLQKDSGKLAKAFENKGYKTFERTGDIYTLFYEKGIELLKTNGILAYITSNKWMRAGYGKSTRAFFCQHNPLKLIDLGSGVFESATVDTNILIIQKTTQKPHSYRLKALDIAKEKNITSFDAFAHRWTTLTQLSDDTWTIASDIEQRIKQKIEQKGKPLKNWDIQINYGIKTGYNEAFIIDGKKKDELIAQDPKSAEIIKPILRGRDIKRYKAEFADLWLIYIPWHFPLHKDENIKGASEKAEKEFEKQYPAIYKHLLSHKEKLSARNKAETGIRYEWYALQRWASDYYPEFEKEKIVYSEIVREPQFYFDTRKFYPEATVFFISGNHLRYLIALLNGKFITWCFKKFYAGGGLGDDGYRYKKAFLEQIPIPALSEEEQLPFVRLVEQILALKEQGKDTTVLEAQIDLLVYKLYDLTYEEVKVIDPAFALSREEYESIEAE